MTHSNREVWLASLRSQDFPADTPLHAFFRWNETRWTKDRRYTITRDLYHLYRKFYEDGAGAVVCVSHLAIQPVVQWRFRSRVFVSHVGLSIALSGPPRLPETPAVVRAHRLVESLLASVGATEFEKHAAVFKAFEDLANFVNFNALAARRPRRIPPPPPPARRKVLVIKLSALGDFVQALGPAAAIRRQHHGDEVTLLTTRPFAELAQQSGLFDNIVIDHRPKIFDLAGWFALRRVLRAGCFDRVYDLQTSKRSSLYAWLFLPGHRPEWSGIAWNCSHPHANLGRYPQHTIDKQAEQLLMAGIYPTPLPYCPASSRPLPARLDGRRFFLLIPGSSPRHSAKRWPAKRYGELARGLLDATDALPIIIGAPGEESLAREICAACPSAIDLVGRTALTNLVDLADAADFTIGNDTGATHIAAAAGHPVFVLFSDASDPSRCAPRGCDIHVLAEPDLADLSVDKVFAACMAVAVAPAKRSIQ